ncbi:cadherin-like beta sandwich domain-containing protein, partial [Mucilaginibacter sp. 5B2]|nr:cadherin-like beta sandwich domain-containing protein [Mucilaginibacter sp. 5B2]
VLNYTANVASNIVSIDVQGFVADTTARYKVNGSVLADRYQPYTVALTGGQNTITLQVTAKNGDVREYRVVINKALSTNATLANLTVNSVQLIPIFAPNVTDYNQTIPFSRTSVNITPTAETAGTTISINGTPVVSGNNINIPIVVGTNTISVVSTAEDGSTTKTYTLNINRTGSGNALLTRIILDPVSTLSATTGSANENYQTSVSPAISSVRLKATAQQADGVIRINGTVVTNDNYSNPITLEVGITVINVVITAQDGITTKSYSITVNRAGSSNASITGLALDPISKLSAITGSASENYQASVSPAISSVRLKATAQQADAVIRVNGTLVTNDNYSNPILLQAGTTVINVVITAQDGITNKSYSITVNRAGSNNAAATGFALDPVSKLSAITGSASENYQASVSPAISSVRLKATTQQADAVIRVNGTVITNDNYSNPILLQAGATVINVVITAQDGVTTKSYSITVNRAGSNNAAATRFALDPISKLSAITGSASENYQASVSPAISSVRLKATTQQADAVIRV